MIRLLSCAVAIAFIATAAHAESLTDSCAPLDETEKLILEAFGGSPLRDLTPDEMKTAEGVILNPGNPQDLAAFSADRVLVSNVNTGDEAVIFVVGDRACSFGFMPAGTIKMIDTIKDGFVGPGEGA